LSSRGTQLSTIKKGLTLAEAAQAIEHELRSVEKAMRQPVEAEIARGKLTAPQRQVMRALVHSDGLSLKQLSREIALSHSTVSGIVDRLQRQGLLDRRVDDEDRRRTVIMVSDQIRTYIRTTLPTLTLNPLSAALRKMTEADRAALLSGLRQLNAALQPPATKA
jgi:DNA-binding MarR family transcriptional regulator